MSDVKTVKKGNPNPEIKKITEQFSHVFKGITKIRDSKNDEHFYAKFIIEPCRGNTSSSEAKTSCLLFARTT